MDWGVVGALAITFCNTNLDATAECFQRFSSFFSHRDHLQTLFDKAEVAFDVDSDLDRARLITAQIRYYENLKKKLVERETEFGMIR